jgi:hypothetical protein
MILTHLVLFGFFQGATASDVEPAPPRTGNRGGWLSPEQVKEYEKRERKALKAERKREQRKQAREQERVRELAEVYDRLTQGETSPAAEKVAETVRPFVRAGTDMVIPPAEAIDWKALSMQRDIVTALKSALIDLQQQEEDEAVMVLLLM